MSTRTSLIGPLGTFNDTYFSTTDMLNAGNRGCNACHEDLFGDVMNMKDG